MIFGMKGLKWLLRFVILIFIIGFFYYGEVIVGLFFLGYLVALLVFIKWERHTPAIYFLDLVLLFLLVLHILGVIWLYQTAYYDDLLHLVGGLLIGAGVYLYLRNLKNFRRISIPLHLMIVFVVSITLSLGVLWELGEFFWDSIFADGVRYGFAQETVRDTMFDLVYDGFGALVGVLMMVYLRNEYWRRGKIRTFIKGFYLKRG